MTRSEIETRAAFDHIRYAQVWEDADVLTDALGDVAGGTLVSICSAGDNVLAMLTSGPDRVVAVDVSLAQIACLRLRIGAFRSLSHNEFLELTGSRPSERRPELLARALAHSDPETRRFWERLSEDVAQFGIGGIGKFERYFRIFRTRLLPFVHSKTTISDVFTPRTEAERALFFDTRFNTFRWRLLLNIFFSRFVMGRFGRDKAFFDHVDGSPAKHVARRLRHAGIETDPSKNPYLRWIMTGTHGAALPMAWRPENYEIIRDRLDRIDIRTGSLEAFLETGEKAQGFNLSDIFEYMSPEMYSRVYGSVLSAATPGARLVYWNMMAPRRVPPAYCERVATLTNLENQLKAQDMAFFYADFVIEEVLG
jgi:S-adenosylmethionine-diacylglycerol 3-amino-3-carboxypropyl transferase